MPRRTLCPTVCNVLCTKNEHLVLKIEGQDALPIDTHVVANCVTEVTSN